MYPSSTGSAIVYVCIKNSFTALSLFLKYGYKNKAVSGPARISAVWLICKFIIISIPVCNQL